MNSIPNKENGFTLAEIVVVTAIVGIIGVSIATFQKDTLNNNRTIAQALQAADDLRNIMRPIAGEVRTARTSEDGRFPIQEATENTFTFYTDYDFDGDVERLRYYLDGTDFKRGIVEPSGAPATYDAGDEDITTIARGIDDSAGYIFQYYDEEYDGNDDPIDSPAPVQDIKLVKIEMTIDTDPLRLPTPLTITTQVSLRNLKENL